MKLSEIAGEVLSLREQAALENEVLKERLETVLPVVMEREKIDLWLVVCREYNEDPVIMTMLPAPAMSARRRTILAFHRQADGEVARYSFDRYGHGEFYRAAWNPEEEPDQFAALRRFVDEVQPNRIGLNNSATFAFGDGLSSVEHGLTLAALGDDWGDRVVSAEMLAVGWLERRTAKEIAFYGRLVEMGHAIIAEAFSRSVITPGTTTTDDVVWWMRQTMSDLGLKAWFQPSIEIQAKGLSFSGIATHEEKRDVIEPGDLLHCDMGFHYRRLATDQQQHAYVLREGESEPPAGLVAALKIGNRLQDIHMEMMAEGKTGNEILAAVREKALAEGIEPQIYSHPLGFHGHAAGPTIGLWDKQGGVPGNGDYPVHDKTAYSIELNAKVPVPEWDDQVVRIALEEDAYFENGECRWLDGRQTELHLI